MLTGSESEVGGSERSAYSAVASDIGSRRPRQLSTATATDDDHLDRAVRGSQR